MAKSKTGAYESDRRTILKIKRDRECDCVVAGFRWYRKSNQPAAGSLLLCLYDDSGALQLVGVCASLPSKTRSELVSFLKGYRKNALAHLPWQTSAKVESERDGQRRPGAQSHWSQGKDLDQLEVAPPAELRAIFPESESSRVCRRRKSVTKPT